jgi:hypothetical protein
MCPSVGSGQLRAGEHVVRHDHPVAVGQSADGVSADPVDRLGDDVMFGARLVQIVIEARLDGPVLDPSAGQCRPAFGAKWVMCNTKRPVPKFGNELNHLLLNRAVIVVVLDGGDMS